MTIEIELEHLANQEHDLGSNLGQDFDINKKYKKQRCYNIFILIFFSICFIWYSFYLVYYMNTYYYNTVIFSAYIYSEPNKDNGTFYMTPCFLGSKLFKEAERNNDSLVPEYTKLKNYGSSYYFLDTWYCNTLIINSEYELISSIEDVINIMDNELYTEVKNHKFYVLNNFIVIIYFVLCVTKLAYSIYYPLSCKKRYIDYMYYGQLLVMTFVSLICVQYYFNSLYNFDYLNSSYTIIQNSSVFEIFFTYVLYLLFVVILHKCIIEKYILFAYK
ncbi:hypothetical protein Hokovirus_2_237 [Hokovirus HKV1]|uniref:Uncharacterized protein n=1 Tax=Hokovirus HKV1 TaxID=1977638 RepID=A0A1V0SG62_9VIRU|nr:hypothetical protein Hokovirus_2_237 [Hokovirus HKV1]